MTDRVRFRRLESNPDLPLPARQTPGSAGYDVASAEADFVLAAGERRLVATGLAMELPADVECQVRLPNSPATIDPDYRGELKVILWNAGAEPVPIPRGTRIAQLVFARFVAPEIEEADALSGSGRGEGGFGSTGR
jgi:dUTP diphosphatase